LLCFALHCFALLCFALHCFALLCFALFWERREKVSHITVSGGWKAKGQGVTCNGFWGLGEMGKGVTCTNGFWGLEGEVALHCSALHCYALLCFALLCIALLCFALLCIALHCLAM
jgi:hypothetical protein